jgi:carbamoyltransferase
MVPACSSASTSPENRDRAGRAPPERTLPAPTTARASQEKTAILGIDGKGEYATTFFGYGENGKIHKIKEFYDPDSLGGLYGAITEYLGFEMLDGEYKVMGMAPYGDPTQIRFLAPGEIRERRTGRQHRLRQRDRPAPLQGKGQGLLLLTQADRMARPDARRRHRRRPLHPLRGKHAEAVRGPVAADDGLLPGRHPARNRQAGLRRRRCAQRQAQPENHRPPGGEGTLRPAASGDAGTAIGAASYVSVQRGVPVEKMEHVYLGPRYSNEDVIAACAGASGKAQWEKVGAGETAVPQRVARILADGNPVAWFQGRMEFGPRALGGRSILGCPSVAGVADRINEQIKFRERWRPFCPSCSTRSGRRCSAADHPAPFMTFTFEVAEDWKSRVPEVVHEDGTSRAQVLKREYNPRYYDLMLELEKLTGNGVVLNTSLNRRGEPMICSPTDALNMFYGSDLEYLVMEDVLVIKDSKGSE